jgi:hypothetical protein
MAVPAFSHAAAFPLYKFEPMRLLVFAAILLSGRRNALLMALWLPLLSFLTSGHPIFPKFVLIQSELAINVLIFFFVYRRWHSFVLGAGISVLASKFVYYLVKFLLIRAAQLDGDLFATPWVYQLATFAFILVGGALVIRGRGGEHA